MGKRITVLISVVIVLLLIITIVLKKSFDKEYVEYNGSLLSISDGNGGTLASVPEQGEYLVTVNCTNAKGSWDYYNWRLSLSNITGNTFCELDFKDMGSPTTLSNHIISLAGTNQGDGQVVNENGYRYEGANPNNYIWFNNELWRIIGVFGSNRHGISNTNLVKIIRNESLGGYTYNGTSDFENNYSISTVYRLLNGCYYNSYTGSQTTNISGSNVACTNYCLGSYASTTNNPTGNCDFSRIGLNNNGNSYSYRDMIQEVTWYLGGPSDSYGDFPATYPSVVYGYETNSSTVFSGYSYSINGPVGLLYPSDYAYSPLSSTCTRGSNNVLTAYNKAGCAGNSWIYRMGSQMTISPDVSGQEGEWIIDAEGNLYGEDIYYGVAVHPVVYLKANIYKHDGDGSISNPYIIGKEYEYENTFNYSANVQSVQIAKGGYYKLEVYGAKGGNGYNSTTYAGGNGGYAKGVVHLNKNDTLYIHTGGAGTGSTSSGVQAGGTNGGGAGGYYRGGSGGGATDIRINTDSLYARVIVGGGGGGGAYRSGYTGGAGGGTTGGDGTGYNTTYNAKGGGTTAGGAAGGYSGYTGTAGSFGQGGAAHTISSTSNYGRSGGGGGGWYGGGGGGYRSNSSYYYYGQSGGGGGSSYYYSSSTASQVPSGYLLTSEYQMTSTSTTAGSNSGDGYAKVTYCGQSASDCS